MSELAIDQLIRIIIGAIVFVVVLLALYFFFKNQVIDFFRGFGGKVSKLFLSLIN